MTAAAAATGRGSIEASSRLSAKSNRSSATGAGARPAGPGAAARSRSSTNTSSTARARAAAAAAANGTARTETARSKSATPAVSPTKSSAAAAAMPQGEAPCAARSLRPPFADIGYDQAEGGDLCSPAQHRNPNLQKFRRVHTSVEEEVREAMHSDDLEELSRAYQRAFAERSDQTCFAVDRRQVRMLAKRIKMFMRKQLRTAIKGHDADMYQALLAQIEASLVLRTLLQQEIKAMMNAVDPEDKYHSRVRWLSSDGVPDEEDVGSVLPTLRRKEGDGAALPTERWQKAIYAQTPSSQGAGASLPTERGKEGSGFSVDKARKGAWSVVLKDIVHKAKKELGRMDSSISDDLNLRYSNQMVAALRDESTTTEEMEEVMHELGQEWLEDCKVRYEST